MSELLKPGAVVSARYRIDAVDPQAREYAGVDLSSGEPVLLVEVGRAEAEAIRPAVGLCGPDLLELLGLEALGGRELAICRVANGASLADAVSEQGLLDPVTAIQTLLPIFTTASHLHRSLAVHGSIAPETIRLDPRPRLAFHPGRPGPSAFRSPERNDGGACSARDDAWALSACLYYALVGEPPARSGIGAPDELIIAGISDQRLRAALFQGLATARVQRVASAEPLRAALREWWAAMADEQAMAATERGLEAEPWGEGEPSSPTLDARALPGGVGGSPLGSAAGGAGVALGSGAALGGARISSSGSPSGASRGGGASREGAQGSEGETPAGRWEPGAAATLESPVYHTPAMPVVAPRVARPQMMSAPGIALELEPTAVQAPSARPSAVRPPAIPPSPHSSGAVTSSAGAPPRPPRSARPTVTAVSPVLPRPPRPARPTVTAVSPVLPSVNKTLQSPRPPSVRPQAPPSVRPPPPSMSQRGVPSEAAASTVRAPSERPPSPVELRSPSSHPSSARPLPPPSVFPSPLQAQAPAGPLPPPPRLPGAPPPPPSASASESQLDELLGEPLAPAMPHDLAGGSRAASASESQLDDLLGAVNEDDASEALLASLEGSAEGVAPPGLGQTQLMEPARSLEPTLESPAYESPAPGAVSPFGRTLMMEPSPPLEGVRGFGSALPGDAEAVGALGGASGGTNGPVGEGGHGGPPLRGAGLLGGAEYGVGALGGAALGGAEYAGASLGGAPPPRRRVGLLVGVGLATFTALGLLTWAMVAALGRSAEPTVVAAGPAGNSSGPAESSAALSGGGTGAVAPGAAAHGAQEVEADSKGGAVQPLNPQAAPSSERAGDAQEPAVVQAPATVGEAPADQPAPAEQPAAAAAAEQPAPAAAEDPQSVRERRARAAAEDKSVGHCVSRWMPEGTFRQPSGFDWMCGQADARIGALELKKAVVRGAGGTVTAAMKTTSRLGWYELTAFTTLRSACCSAPAPITLPEPAAHCEALAPLITKLADTVLSGEAYEPALAAFISAANCEASSGRAGAYWMKRAPTGTERSAFESWVRALRR
ncbi:MAG: hypothetical protein KIT72_07465 [Polyangiaceae bacterium]|nr:hypothetical protein [Polyangiaceae bacterium]MCW5790242.1 hypothetical protein [Polyangiaceae bacterium]